MARAREEACERRGVVEGHAGKRAVVETGVVARFGDVASTYFAMSEYTLPPVFFMEVFITNEFGFTKS